MTFYFLLPVILLVTGISGASPALRNTSSPILQSGDTIVRAHFGKSNVQVTIRTLRIQNTATGGYPLGQEAGNTAVTIVHDLIILVNGHPLLVPYSIFSDLTDPREAELEPKRNFTVLSIYGGDGADSYKLQVYFDSAKVSQRKLYDLMVPDELLEETHYRLRILEDKP